jgi:glutamate-1-semialdehyde aminotransferase
LACSSTLRYSGVFVPWFHDAFISASHSDEDVEHVLAAHQASAEAALALHDLV